ncbi:alpha-L-fucosidase [Novipirellula artificiosorum]|uniref:alpha-L-fucosidase n=1 Tax=Novipirellula artificiosorum TaxID=2528016 RepID=A0A5C6DZ92_9BACT|nr:alpha-L-fucosidase [Novipirellula artificiosorum]TWU40396.1 Alpha-L-fucosidase [Novipirellula artificiosorum]
MTLKRFSLCLLLFSVVLSHCPSSKVNAYEPDWKSLQEYDIPDWMADAKFGIFIHWGPSCVPGYRTDWYPRWMYQDKVQWNHRTGEIQAHRPHPAYLYHVKTYGAPSQFGYKNFFPLFKAEEFDAEAWVDLFVKSGAKYVIPVAEHHDSYAMYASKFTRWNSVDTGPQRDILGELRTEIKKQKLIFGVSSHLAFNWDFYNQQPHFDTGDPNYADLYAPQHEPYSNTSAEFLKTWWLRTKDIIDNYEPDILWFDFGIDRAEWAPYHARLAAYYYNSGLKRGVTPVLQTKNLSYDSYPAGTHMLDLERSKSDQMLDELWQTDTSVGINSWFYCREWVSKSSNLLIDDLIDIVSKNGCLLLNIGPDASGRIPADQANVLLEIGEWLQVNGEAVYGTRPWHVYGEGPTQVATGHLSEDKNQKFNSQDIRFTQKGDTVYAIILQAPEGKTLIHSLNASTHEELKNIKSISVLGSERTLDWAMTDQGLQIGRIETPPFESAVVLKIDCQQL